MSHTHLMRDPINAPLPAGEIERIDATLAAFVAGYEKPDGNFGLDEVPPGDGSARDIEALDYIVYESLYGLFAEDRSDFLEMAAVVFGNCLRRMLKLEWCITDLPSGRVLAVCAPGETRGPTVPLEAMIAFRLSGGPQYEGFEWLFCDIVASQPQWDTGVYFLQDASWMDAESLAGTWGFDVPGDVRVRLAYFHDADPERLLRRVGMCGFPCGGPPDWDALRTRLVALEQELSECFPDGRRPPPSA